jgi:hypothetical protein
LLSTPNPDAEPGQTLPPLTVGKAESAEKFLTIGRTKEPKTYLETERKHDSRGAELQNSAGLEFSRLVAGQPGQHTRLQVFPPPTAPPYSPPNQPVYIYRLSTPDCLPISDNPETISFPDVSDPLIGRSCAQTQVSIENSQSTTVSLSVRHDFKYLPGDRMWWRGVEWWILEITAGYTIKRDQINYSDFRLKLGKLVRVPVSLSSSQQ